MDLFPAPLSISSTLYNAEISASSHAVKGGESSAEEWTTEINTIANHTPLPLLFAAEKEYLLSSDYLHRSHDCIARRDSINWILKVIEFYQFNPVTAYRSVDYLDRFLSTNSLPVTEGENGKKQSGGGWPMQLLCVACLSIAAKMEETHVPVLLDLQILDPKYVFEPRTIRRMELLILTVLTWRMRAVTPFDFLPYLAASVLPVDSAAILSRATNLIISSRRAVVDFVRFWPSTIAAAAVLCASVKIAATSASDNAVGFSYFSEWDNRDVVGECRQLMEEYLIDACPSEPPPSHSPVGSLSAAACVSSNVEKSSAGVVKAEPPPLKRRRLVDGECG
ncbi:hypothetical protein M5K25_005664 [Dendrobium thyrsiflorum]|uniref:Cyclin N-terminal domain-containing protein n=1 Tax=Dendrobium thyrsiflorum TaxID=117978 RepID=A0ABD0VPP8_DENTH